MRYEQSANVAPVPGRLAGRSGPALLAFQLGGFIHSADSRTRSECYSGGARCRLCDRVHLSVDRILAGPWLARAKAWAIGAVLAAAPPAMG